jgi:hypothetical protein
MRRLSLTNAVILFGFVMGTTLAAFAAEEKVTLMGAKDEPKATGTATIGRDTITLLAKGLKSNSVYSVWWVNMQPTMEKAGVGQPPYSFKTDAKGNGTYKASLKGQDRSKWQTLMIVRHPSGDPTDMTRMEDALMAKLM